MAMTKMPESSQDQSLSNQMLVTVAWRLHDKEYGQAFGPGRYLIGTSDICHIQIPGREDGIFLTLQVASDDITIRYINSTLPCRYEGRQLEQGRKIFIGHQLDLILGRINLTITKQREATIAANGSVREAQGWQPQQFNQLLAHLNKELLARMDTSGIDLSDISKSETRNRIKDLLWEVMDHEELGSFSASATADLHTAVFHEIVGLGPLENILADDDVSEIMVNHAGQIYVEKAGNLTLSPITFSSEQALLTAIERIVSQVGRRIDTSSPVVDARLLDGSRVNAIIPPIALKGASLTIRRFAKDPISVDQLIAWQSLSPLAASLLQLFVEAHTNMVVSGGTGSGKTTLLNALSSFIPATERIITIEDAAELQLQQDHVVSLETRPPNLEGRGAVTIRDLVKNSLRMRPDRIVVGECRGGEALDMLQAMNTGHDGSLTTAHANNPEDLLRRLETMVLMAGVDFPLKAIREQVASAVDIIVQQSRLTTGRRLVTHIEWVKGLAPDSGTYETLPLLQFERQEGSDQGTAFFYRAHIIAFAQYKNIAAQVATLLESCDLEITAWR